MTNKDQISRITNLTCVIPSYIEQLDNIIKKGDASILYTSFIKNFFAYLPADYIATIQLEELHKIAEKAFAFFKTRRLQQRKLLVTENLHSNNMLSISLLIDDKNFIVDSLTTLFTTLNLAVSFIVYPVFNVKRNSEGEIEFVAKERNDKVTETSQEVMVYLEIKGSFTPEDIKRITNNLHVVLDQIDETCNTWLSMLQELDNTTAYISKNHKQPFSEHFGEVVEFLTWLKNSNFTFLACVDFSTQTNKLTNIIGIKEIWDNNLSEIQDIIHMSSGKERENEIVVLGKINAISKVHRNDIIDYILIKYYDHLGHYIGGKIFLGLYSARIDYQSIKHFPILKRKLKEILVRTGFVEESYNYSKLSAILDSLPRELLIQVTIEDLYCMSLQMLSSLDSRKLKLFIHSDSTNQFINIVIFAPKLRLSPEIHNNINIYLEEALRGRIIISDVKLLMQDFAYLFVTIAVTQTLEDNIFSNIEAKINQISTLWEELFIQEMSGYIKQSKLDNEYFSQFINIFPIEYRHKFSVKVALEDLINLRQSVSQNKTVFKLLSTDNQGVSANPELTLKIYTLEKKLELSNILPSIESLGFNAIDEQSFLIEKIDDLKYSFIHVFNINVQAKISYDIQNLASNVEEILSKITDATIGNDQLNKLVLVCGFKWREVQLFNALIKYLHQIGFVYTQEYIASTLIKHHDYSKLILQLFDGKFNPNNINRETTLNFLSKSIEEYLEKVTNSTEDKILRNIFTLCSAMVRTNYYQELNNQPKNYISFKFNSQQINFLKAPIPYAEIFVYANHFEGVHLRGGKVARGGIRWSDRIEDYRVEVLGLMKAQMTKNAVIVPVGSKGGFVIKFTQEACASNEAYMQKVIASYQEFLSGLLDITDNIIDGKIIYPLNTIIYDNEDPYLVVAADKGTASFSDYANEISAKYNYWLRDAFASGGSRGYDHKKMGITAKGAWISVQHHFKYLGIDVNKDAITVVGIGDMAGDVFGNGMLLSDQIKLVAAFNHAHIFIDPSPNVDTSFQERLRLFNLPRSKWTDYNKDIISNGGGVFDRSSKMIMLTSEIKELLDIEVNIIAPDDLIKYILKARVDLIWNGGIGTYVKASFENNVDIGDKANDNLRCDGCEIRAKVIAEGGNLGLSQKGRIEYDKFGGLVNTDFIDNSAGVDCSDHEVNIKIALNNAITNSKITLQERDNLLHDMANQVEKLVLEDNFKQNQAISIAQCSKAFNIGMFSKLIDSLEEEKLLDRKIEFLPNTVELIKRSNNKENLTRPELAVLLSYSKMSINKELMASDIWEHNYFSQLLVDYFPQMMREKFLAEILSHNLRKEIISTVITNKIINQLGGININIIKRETGASTVEIVKAYAVVCEIFNLDTLWQKVESLEVTISKDVVIEMFTEIAKMIRRGVAWLIRNLGSDMFIENTIDQFSTHAKPLSKIIPALLFGNAKNKFDSKINRYIEAGVSDNLANSIATLDSLVSVFDIIHIANNTKVDEELIAKLYFKVGEEFYVDWLRKICEKQANDSYWSKLSIQSLKDDLYDKQRRLVIAIASSGHDIITWSKEYQKFIDVFLGFIHRLQIQEDIDLNVVILANKKFENLLRAISTL